MFTNRGFGFRVLGSGFWLLGSGFGVLDLVRAFKVARSRGFRDERFESLGVWCLQFKIFGVARGFAAQGWGFNGDFGDFGILLSGQCKT